MGAKKSDVLCKPPDAATGLTLGAMHPARWRIHAAGPKRSLRVRASLKLLIRPHGPGVAWRGRRAPCPRVRHGWSCGGLLTYSVQSIRGGRGVSMRDPAPDRVREAWLAKRGRFYAGER